MNHTLIILTLLFAVGLLLWGISHFQLRKYFRRSCQGKEWKRAFPTAEKNEIREFLGAFTEAFSLPRRLKLKFRPQDKPIDIYNIVAGHVDSFEFEEFSMNLEQKFGRGLSEEIDDSWTLEDIFKHVSKGAYPDRGINSLPPPSTS